MICPLLSINGIEWVTCDEGIAKLNNSKKGHVCSFWMVQKATKAGADIDLGECGLMLGVRALIQCARIADGYEKPPEVR